MTELHKQALVRGPGYTLTNVRNVFALGDGRWACTVDMVDDAGAIETVPYVASADDGEMTGRWVVARITNGMAGAVGTAAEYATAQATRDDAAWAALDEAEQRDRLLARLADLRWQRETAGIVIDGMTVATDRNAQAMITGAAVAAQMEGDAYSLRWKTAGGFVSLTGIQVLALARAVRAHVQACFDAEAAMIDRIQAGEVTALDDLEEAWSAA